MKFLDTNITFDEIKQSLKDYDQIITLQILFDILERFEKEKLGNIVNKAVTSQLKRQTADQFEIKIFQEESKKKREQNYTPTKTYDNDVLDLIERHRQSGQTTALIETCLKYGGILICANHATANFRKQHFPELNVLTISNIENRGVSHHSEKPLFFDTDAVAELALKIKSLQKEKAAANEEVKIMVVENKMLNETIRELQIILHNKNLEIKDLKQALEY